MLVKQFWQIGILLGALLLIGTAQAAEQGYWKLSSDAMYLQKSVPPVGPAKQRLNGWDIRFDEVAPGKAKWTASFGKTSTTVVEYTWSAPPTIILPDQVVPASGKIVATRTGLGHMAGIICQLLASKKDKNGDDIPAGEALNVFADVKHYVGIPIPGVSLEIANTTRKYGKGAKGAVIFLRFSASNPVGAIEEAWRYNWVEGTPPAPK